MNPRTTSPRCPGTFAAPLRLAALLLIAIGCHQPGPVAEFPAAGPGQGSFQSAAAEAQPGSLSAAQPEARPKARPPQVHSTTPFQDANGNGVDDSIDIVYMTSADENNNGIPDEAEIDW